MSEKTKILNRVTHETLQDGIVTSATTASHSSWAGAYIASLDSWQCDEIIARALMRKMNHLLDLCESPGDISKYDDFLQAAWGMLDRLVLLSNKELISLKEYESEIRSGKHFEEDDE